MSFFQELTELQDVLREVGERRAKLDKDMETLNLSQQGESTLREMLSGLDDILYRLRGITEGIGEANDSRNQAIKEEESSLEYKLREAIVELERSRAETDRERAEENSRRKSEDAVYRDIKKALQKALGPAAKEATKAAKAVIDQEFGDDEPESVQAVDDMYVGELKTVEESVNENTEDEDDRSL